VVDATGSKIPARTAATFSRAAHCQVGTRRPAHGFARSLPSSRENAAHERVHRHELWSSAPLRAPFDIRNGLTVVRAIEFILSVGLERARTASKQTGTAPSFSDRAAPTRRRPVLLNSLRRPHRKPINHASDYRLSAADIELSSDAVAALRMPLGRVLGLPQVCSIGLARSRGPCGLLTLARWRVPQRCQVRLNQPERALA
jgi:hypothetical protein